jgi:hypothetical protein
MAPVQIDLAPDVRQLTIAQRSSDAEQGLGQQVYTMDPTNGSLTPLLVEANYDHQALAWDPSARYLARERSLVRATDPSQGSDVRSQVWLYDTTTGDLTRLAASAFRPHWLP